MININIRPLWDHVVGKESGYNDIDLNYAYSRKLAHEVVDEALERFGYHLPDEEYDRVYKLHEYISNRDEQALKESLFEFGDYALIIE